MPANTSPDNIVYPVSTDPVAPLESVFASMATSVQTALNSKASTTDTGWIVPTLNAGWTNSDMIAYRRLNGVVYIRGSGASIGATAAAFALPVGFRPDVNRSFFLDSVGSPVRSAITASSGNVGPVAAASLASLSFGGTPVFIAA